MKVIFLDIDGVLAAFPFGPARPIWTYSGNRDVQYSLNHDCVERLNRLVEASDARIVISSTWRKFWPYDAIASFMKQDGFKYQENVIGRTVELPGIYDDQGRYLRSPERGDEIMEWINAYPDITSYVVLDDDSDIGSLPASRWVNVYNGLNAGGLLDKHVDAALVQLGIPL